MVEHAKAMTAWARALPSAQAALERVEAKHADCVACIAYDAVCTGNSVQAFRLSDLRTRIARLEAALIAASYVVEKFASIGIRDEATGQTGEELMTQINVALEGRDA